MKRMNRLLVATVLLGQIAGMTIPSAYAVTTITSSNKETVAPSAEQTTASTTLQEQKSAEEKQLEPAPVRQPTYSTEEKTYDERKLTKVEKLDEENQEPQIIFQKETVDQAIVLKGEFIARESKPDENKSETKLTQLILQSRKEGGKWETAQTVELPENKPILLNEEAFKFEFQQQPEEAGSYDYRLAVDYEQSEFEGDQLSKVVTHKASYDVGILTIEEKQPETSSSSTEESSAIEESQSSETTKSTSTEESSNTEESSSEAITSQEEIERSTTESSETNVENTDETTKQSDDDSKSKEDEVPPLDLAEANKDLPVLPQMKVTKKQQEKEAARNNLMKPTWAVVTDDKYEWGNAVRTYEADTVIRVENITKTSGQLSGQYYNNSDLYKYGAPILVWSDDLSDVTGNAIYYDEANRSKFDGSDTSDFGLRKSKIYEYNGKHKMAYVNDQYVDRDYPKKGIYFTNYSEDHETYPLINNPFTGLKPGTKYYFNMYYAYNSTRYERIYFHESGDQNSDGKGGMTAYHFKTKDPEPLKINTPVFGDATDSSLKMLSTSNNTYTGDPATEGDTKGYIDAFKYNPESPEENKWTTWGGNNDEGRGEMSTYADGRYTLGSITNLEPGTWYRLKAARRQMTNGVHVSSELSDQAATKVRALAPDASSVSFPEPPSAWDEVKANINASYQAGDCAPSGDKENFKVQLKVGESDWWVVRPENIDLEVKPNDRMLTMKFKNLYVNGDYQVKYQVENTAGWSDESEVAHFRTPALPMQIGTPVFGNATDTSIDMLESSDNTYTGDLATEGDTIGYTDTVSYNPVSEEWNIDEGNNVGRGNLSEFADGKYTLGTRTGLRPGTWYKSRVGRRQAYNGRFVYSEWVQAATKVKVNAPDSNTVTYPEPPSAWDKASATIRATYQAGDCAPMELNGNFNIQYKLATASDWTNATSDKVETEADTDERNVTIKFTNLYVNGDYEVRYQVQNAAGWSAWSDAGSFRTPALPMWIGTPVFGNGTATSFDMLPTSDTRYTGDLATDGDTIGYTDALIYNPESGVYDILASNNNDGRGITSTFADGNYSLGKITHLNPGTKYELQLARRQAYNGRFVYSERVPVVTKVRANTPDSNLTWYPSDPPQAENQAKASVFANYDASDALPTEFKAEIKEDGGEWVNPAEEEVDQLIQFTNNTEDKTVGIYLKNLATKKKYYVKYQALNSGGWSEWSEPVAIQTQGIQLKISQPKFYQEAAEPTKVKMKPGTYTGDTYSGSDTSIRSELKLVSGLDEQHRTSESFDLDYGSGIYNSEERIFTNLEPGTHYRVYANIPDYEGVIRSGRGEGNDYDGGDFVTPTKLTSAGSVSHSSTGYDNATVTISGTYQVGGPNTKPAHPRNGDDFSIKYRKIGDLNWIDIDENSTNLVGDPTIDTQGKRVSFTLGGLLEGTEYEVQYSVKNASEVWSNVIEERVETDQRPDGLYIGTDHLSGFHFSNTLMTSPNTQSIGLTAPLIGSTNQPAWINIDNIGVENNWKMGATLSKITKVGDESVELTGAELTIGKSLEKRDSSGDWGTVASSDPIAGLADSSATLVQEEPQILWESTNVAYGKGYFRHMIDHDSVQLMIPGSSGQLRTQYEGEVTWTLSNAL